MTYIAYYIPSHLSTLFRKIFSLFQKNPPLSGISLKSSPENIPLKSHSHKAPAFPHNNIPLKSPPQKHPLYSLSEIVSRKHSPKIAFPQSPRIPTNATPIEHFLPVRENYDTANPIHNLDYIQHIHPIPPTTYPNRLLTPTKKGQAPAQPFRASTRNSTIRQNQMPHHKHAFYKISFYPPEAPL